MIRRCTDPTHKSWADYGARGITVCDRWLNSFDAYYADTGDAPGPGYTIDRIDNDRGYEPSNVRWATRSEQNSNTRRSRTSGGYCIAGHEFTEANTYISPKGHTDCRTCRSERTRRYYARKRAAKKGEAA